MRILLHLLTVVFGFLAVSTAMIIMADVGHGADTPWKSVFIGFFFLILALVCWDKARVAPKDEK
jgi:hypothetical protein